MNTQLPRTPRVSEERRAGVYEHEEDVTSLLWYGTHTLFDLPLSRRLTTVGLALDRDIVLHGEGISAHQCVLERRASGMLVKDDGSTNGLACESGRSYVLALRPVFQDKRDSGEGFNLAPGMTFALNVITGPPYRFVALDDAMRSHHAELVEILGREDEVRTANADGETPSPSDLILAADSPGHIVITGPRGCEHGALARIIHKISKRRRQAEVNLDHVPSDRRAQARLLKVDAAKRTLVLDISKSDEPLDPAFVSQLFSPVYEIRVIVIARSPKQAADVLGERHYHPLMHAALCPMAKRQAAIYRLLDQWLAAKDSILRMEDLTEENQRALLYNEWRENLTGLRKAAVRLDAIAMSGFSRPQAAEALGISRQSLDNWYNITMGLLPDLVPPSRKRELLAELARRTPGRQ